MVTAGAAFNCACRHEPRAHAMRDGSCSLCDCTGQHRPVAGGWAKYLNRPANCGHVARRAGCRDCSAWLAEQAEARRERA